MGQGRFSKDSLPCFLPLQSAADIGQIQELQLHLEEAKKEKQKLREQVCAHSSHAVEEHRSPLFPQDDPVLCSTSVVCQPNPETPSAPKYRSSHTGHRCLAPPSTQAVQASFNAGFSHLFLSPSEKSFPKEERMSVSELYHIESSSS